MPPNDDQALDVGLGGGAGTIKAPDLVLEPADQTVAGRVVDEDGKPVAGAEVAARAGVNDGNNITICNLATAMTRADGTFILTGLGASPCTISATLPGATSDSVTASPAVLGNLTLKMRLPAPPEPPLVDPPDMP
jgi:hypothetical protein